MRHALQRAWLRRGPLAAALWPLSLLFRLLVATRRTLYRRGLLRSESAPVPVLVVGNVVAGGAGKTPIVMALVVHLRDRGIRIGVVSRGHGRRTGDCVEVTPGAAAEDTGDEPLLIATRCRVPVFVAARRIEAVRALLARHPDTQLVVSDDGLQHLAMARDVELCVFDDRGVGNGWLLPAGPLREPWPRAVDAVLRTPGTRGIDGYVVQRRLAGHASRSDGTRIDLRQLAAQPCDALAGIAQPEAFFGMLRAAGVPLRHTLALPDHHDFGTGAPPVDGDTPLLCTEKDAVKLWRTYPQAWAVALDVEIDPAFWDRLQALLGPQLSSPDGSETA